MHKSFDVRFHSSHDHNIQILNGFNQLNGKDGYSVSIQDIRKSDDGKEYPEVSIIDVYTDDGLMLVYDTMDGYQNPEAMRFYLEKCDYYFKRSFSREKNQMFGKDSEKMYPLGFNYLVSYKECPIKQDFSKRIIKTLCGRKNFEYFTEDKFISKPEFTTEPKIIFCTRLWKTKPEMNKMRTELIRTLRKKYPDRFFGGLADEENSRNIAPELIIPSKYTIREKYLKKMTESDICVASTGLHESIGWKTGEYVAAAKGIVSEKLCYEVPGDFEDGKNYLGFESVEECVKAIYELDKNPDMLFEMKKANAKYYEEYLQPEQLIRNTINIAYAKKIRCAD